LEDLVAMFRYWSVSEDGYRFSNELVNNQDLSILVNELETLYIDDKADKEDCCYLIKHEVAASFDEYERDLLQLPEVFPYFISISTLHGNLGSRNFRYLIDFLQPNNMPFVNPKVIQSYIQINSNLCYMFNTDQYNIVKIANTCNHDIAKITSNGEVINFNLSNLDTIKDVGKRCEARFDKFLASNNVVKPDKLTVSARRGADGSIIVEPVLLKKVVDQGSNNIVYKKIASSTFVKSYEKQNDVKSTYLGGNGERFVLDRALEDGLNIIKKHRSMSEEEYKRCSMQPKETFNSPVFEFENISDGDILKKDRVNEYKDGNTHTNNIAESKDEVSHEDNFTDDGKQNEQEYADRVNGIGEFIRAPLPYIKLESNNWLPDEGVTKGAEDGIDWPEITDSNVDELKLMIKNALEQKADKVEFNGKTISLEPKFIDSVVKKYDAKHNTNTLNPDNINNKEQIIKKPVLLIEENFETLGYAHEEHPTLKKINPFSCLKKGVELFPHQKAGIAWMCKCLNEGHRGVLLADDMGLGKTIQALTFMCCYKLNKLNIHEDCKSILIVAPVALLSNWKEEYYKFVNPGLFNKVVELWAGNINKYRNSSDKVDLSCIAKNDVVLTTYETLREFQLSFGLIDWSIMILDEAQKIKTPNIRVTQAAKAMKYDFGMCLTGTPVENSWTDLWSIMDFVEPGKLNTLKVFANKYQKRLGDLKNDEVGLATLGAQLKRDIDPLFCRRLKKDCLADLPQKHVIKCKQAMTETQKNAYDTVIASAREAKSKMNKKNALEILAMIRDISLFPNLKEYSPYAYCNMDCNEIINQSARLKKTFEILHEVKKKNEKVLIFVISRRMQTLLQYLIEKIFSIQVPPPINGELLGQRRQALVNDFNSSEGFSVLILSPEAGGVGFNITSANHVIHLSRSWNPAKEDQATDRVYRIGQEKDVFVYIPMAIHSDFGEDGSFDEKLDRLLDYKRKLSENVLFPTSDTDDDGLRVFEELTGKMGEETAACYWTMNEIRNASGVAFEKIICNLFINMKYQAHTTPQSNDNGADIVVFCDTVKHTGYLVQCKQTTTENNMGVEGVEQIVSAIKYYERLYSPYKFKGIVVTNAPRFTNGATLRANANDVELWDRSKISELIDKYPVKKFYS
jgi:SNF2 family DNA or RNA helicase